MACARNFPECLPAAGGQSGIQARQGEPDRRVPKHLTFTGQQSGIDRFVSVLHQPRVVVADRATHGAMRAKSAYFSYPDGHDLELCEPLAYI